MDELDLGATIRGFSVGQKVFGRYTLKKILGRGGMGVVWLARDEKLDREVALKFLPEVVKSDRGAMDDLKRETRRALDLTHTHIVRIYDFVEDTTTAAIAMEYVPGDTLSNRRLDQPARVFEPGELRRWVKQLCEALAYAHEKARIVHRDLKPANLMLDAHGDLKVADFGISRSISDSVSRVSAQAGSSGTPAYMSPQQMMGEKPELADDVYALGATLYELLTGKPPFFSGNLIAQVQSKLPASIAERRRELEVAGAPVPPEWEAAIAACLAKEPAQRPPSVREVAKRLGLAVSMDTAAPFAPAPVRTPPKSPAPSTAPAPVARPAWLYPVIAAVVLAAGAGYYFGVYAPEQERLAREQAKRGELGQQAELRRVQQAAEQEKAKAVEAKAKAEREQTDYTAIMARIDGVRDDTPRADLDGAGRAVQEYLAAAPERFKAAVEQAWEKRRTAWLAYEVAHRLGSLVVETDPPGATVILYPANIRKTSPAVFKDIKPGEVSFRVEKDGFEAQDVPIELKPGSETKAGLVRLVSLMGSAVITSEPAGAKVSLDGNSRHFDGVTPFRQEMIPPGTYRATFQRANWRPVEKNLVVKRNEETGLTANLRGVDLDIRSNPAGAQVKLNGREVGLTPLSLTDQAPGEYQLSFTKEGYDPASRSIAVEDRATVNETLVRSVPKITRLVLFRAKVIYVGSGSVTLKIDGAVVGKLSNGTYWVKELPAGAHTVALRVLGIEVLSRQVQLEEGTTTYLEMVQNFSSGDLRRTMDAEALEKIATLKIDPTSPDQLQASGAVTAPQSNAPQGKLPKKLF